MEPDGQFSRRGVLAAGLSSCVIGMGGCSGPRGSFQADSNSSPGETTETGRADDDSGSAGNKNQDWPTMHGNLARSGVTAAAGPTGGVEEVWHFDAEAGFGASAVVVDGTLYALDRNGGLHARSLETGAEFWTTSVSSAASGIAVADERVVVVQDAGIAVLDAASGEKRWEMDLQSGTTENVLVADLPLGGETAETTRSIVTAEDRSELLAIDATEQSIAWRFSTRGPIRGAPAYANGRIYVVSRRFLYAFDPGTGDNVWVSRLGNPTVGVPTVVDGTVYVGDTNGNIRAVDAASGETAWTTQLDASVEASLAVDAGAIFAGTLEEQVHRLDATTGEVDWTFDTDGRITGAPVLADSTLYVPSEDGHCYALDASTGAFEWRVAANDAIATTPVVLGGRLYVGDASGRFYALASGATVGRNPNSLSEMTVEGSWPSWQYDDGNTGHVGRDGPVEDAVERWDHQLPSRPDDLLVMDGTVYISTVEDGRFVSIDAATGDRERQLSHEDLGGPISLGNGSVYASTGGAVHSFDRSEGTRSWQTELGRWQTRVAVQDDRLVVPYIPDDDPFTSGLAALDPGDGAIRWSVDLDGKVEYPIAVADDTAFLSTDQSLIAIDLSERAERWSVTLDQGIDSAPTATDEAVYVLGSRGRLHAFERDSGRERWTADVPPGTKTAVAVGEDVVVAAGRTVTAIETADGSERWSADPDVLSGESPPVIGATTAYIPDLGGISALDLATGERRWQTKPSGTEWFGALLLVDGLVVAAYGNEVVAYQEDQR